MNAIFNAWNPYQTVNTFLTRAAMGFEQDVLGIVHMLPAEVRKRLLVLLSHEFQNGATTHDYSPDPQFSVLKDGVMRDGDVRFGAKAGTTLEEQFGSRGLRSAVVGRARRQRLCQRDRRLRPPPRDAPLPRRRRLRVLDHLQRILDCSWSRRGLYGLPLLREMDWNDSLQLPAAR